MTCPCCARRKIGDPEGERISAAVEQLVKLIDKEGSIGWKQTLTIKSTNPVWDVDIHRIYQEKSK